MSDSRLEIQMLHDRVLVSPSAAEGERRSTGGIVIPATASVSKRLSWGDVYGTGNHVRTVKVGDRVLYGPDDHAEVEVDGRSFVVMRERDVHAVASENIEPTSGTGLYL
ncbi:MULTISPECIES: co-chaperone GroES [Actinomycetospora]|uniref:GroES family chaperonin n=2 Tax=Actinomycetospora TaxID=402649 RepID=UPI0003A94546|nr:MULTISPECIES: co-chaperone GroES [Actinomycetospora]GLZ54989.1 10 kDa chaperonin [Actinomycetospora sp. NBRC 106378]